jgi:3-methylcrotonyl-CoA carboxylase alpha subunit
VGKLEILHLPEARDGIRIDAGVRQGDEVTIFYDPMIAKVIAWDETREGAAAKLANALAHTDVAGVRTNAGFLVRALRQSDFVVGDIDTGFIERNSVALMPVRSGAPPHILTRAASFIVEEREARRRGGDPWDESDGFRLAGSSSETIEFLVGEKKAEVRIVHHRGGVMSVTVDAREFDMHAHAARVARLSSGAIVVMETGETWTLSLYDPFAAADSVGATTDRVSTPMPGKIVQVLVKAGDSVKRGQALAVLEAMKMEHTLSAPADAKVASVDVSPGDQVTDGATVVRFEMEKAA